MGRGRARAKRFGAGTVVPNVVGRSVPDAWTTTREHELFLRSAGPDDPPIDAFFHPDVWVVQVQEPAPGQRAAVGSDVVVVLRRDDGGGGVREPRRPRPSPRAVGAALRPSDSDL